VHAWSNGIAIPLVHWRWRIRPWRSAIRCARLCGSRPGYQVTYRINEAYALLGTGAIDEALARLGALQELHHPRYQAARLQSLIDLAVLIAADQRGDWTALQLAALTQVIRELRELEWQNVLPLLPRQVARLFARALASGVEPDWVRASIRTRGLPAPRGAPEAWPWAVKIRVLGGFEVLTEAGPLAGRAAEARKASSKPLELLRCLASRGIEAQPVDQVAHALWPGDGREGRQKAFDVTVARLRRLLDCDAAVTIYDRRVGLNREIVWVDVQALSERLVETEAALEGSAGAGAALAAALGLYRGPCLADSTQAWASAARDRLRERLAAALLHATRGPGVAATQARAWTLRATAADPPLGLLIDPG
jgi:hypothetical protein